jgi:protein-disulfide isomerase
VIASVALFAVPALSAPPPPTGAAAQQALLAPRKSDRILGKPNAPITIIEYASMTCPHCAHFSNEVLPELKKKWIDTGKAKLVMRPFPLDEVALRAEMLARCLPPERYYPMIETLFKTQERWVVKDWRPALERIARVAGISDKEFNACLANKALEDEIVQSRLTAATQLDVNGTPTLFVNGKKFEGPPTVEALNELLSGLAETTTADAAKPQAEAAPQAPAASAAQPAAAKPNAVAEAACAAQQAANALGAKAKEAGNAQAEAAASKASEAIGAFCTW